MIDVKEQQDLLLDISRKLVKKIVVYAIGGTAMMFHGLKEATKDIDLVFLKDEDKKEFKKIAEDLGYKRIDSNIVYGLKENQPIMLTRGKGEERFDLFGVEVIDFIFSEDMTIRASDTHEFGHKLILKVANPHDIILMKCATDRLKDKDDARTIINNYKIDWDIIINEAVNQIRLGKNRSLWFLAEFFDDLEKLGTNIPKEITKKVFKQLENQTSSKEKQSELKKFITK